MGETGARAPGIGTSPPGSAHGPAHGPAPGFARARRTVALPTGTLTLEVDDGAALDALCDFASRRNPRRGFLVVSRVLGRHLPTRPGAMRASMAALAAPLADADLEGPVLFVGMAETATALGHGVRDAWAGMTGRDDALYLQSSRQRVAGATLLTTFEEGHSHASTHLVQVAPALVDGLRAVRTLVIVDDEASTGATFVAAARALVDALPNVAAVRTAVITDWSEGRHLGAMPRPTVAHSALAGSLRWEPVASGGATEAVGATEVTGAIDPSAPPPASARAAAPTLAAATNEPGTAPARGTPARHGVDRHPRPTRTPLELDAARRWTVLGDGEFSWEALLLAEEIEAAGGTAFVQCITRSPVLVGHAMESVTPVSDSYGSGAPCFVHNLLGGAPERVVVVSENEGGQAREIGAWLAERGHGDVPVSLVTCRFDGAGTLDRHDAPGGTGA